MEPLRSNNRTALSAWLPSPNAACPCGSSTPNPTRRGRRIASRPDHAWRPSAKTRRSVNHGEVTRPSARPLDVVPGHEVPHQLAGASALEAVLEPQVFTAHVAVVLDGHAPTPGSIDRALDAQAIVTVA